MSSQSPSFEKLVFDGPDCVKVLDFEARLVSMNESGRIALCIENFADVAGSDWRTFWNGEDRVAADAAVRAAVQGGVGHFIGRHDVAGDERWWDVTVSLMPGTGAPAQLLAISRDVTGSRSSEVREVIRRDRVENRLRAIDRASTLLSSSLDFDVTLSAIADIAVETFAAICVMQAVDRSERLHSAVGSHRPESSERLDALRGVVETMRLAAPSSEWDETAPEVAATLHDVKVASAISVPIVHRGVKNGSLTLFVNESDRKAGIGMPFDPVDRLFVEVKILGRRAGVALANARSYGREHAIALRMQESALPRILPRIDHLHLSAAYRPSTTESTIGGDWFDAFQLPDGRVALSIGDVGGHGLTAALTMTKLRQAMRAAALLQPSPLAMLNVAERTLRMDGDDLYATTIGAIYDPRAHRLELSSAGHPGPFLRYSDGRIEELDCSGPLLGIGHTFESVKSLETEPGMLAIFFTDGLVEFDRDINAGYLRLEGALARLPVEGSSDPANRLIEDVIGANPTPDDVAVLTAYFAFAGI